MDQSEAIVRLLEEIRNNQREQLAEYKRFNQEYIEVHRAAVEKSEDQYTRYLDACREQPAEYERVNREYAEMYRKASDRYDEQYRQYLQASRPNLWAILLFLAGCAVGGYFVFTQASTFK